jgi:hypothetical protein
MSQLTIGAPAAADKADWRRLYDGYAAFYKMPMNDEIADRVWGWINDPAHGLGAADRGDRAPQSKAGRACRAGRCLPNRRRRRVVESRLRSDNSLQPPFGQPAAAARHSGARLRR